ncbi:unnamed protein product [Orchesella dallaii]|uniref:Uncharacterized protein n=1 Tax=Orchesella dallaii TaxID=48710 RepID=A0ABP1Q2G5_9HEXA
MVSLLQTIFLGLGYTILFQYIELGAHQLNPVLKSNISTIWRLNHWLQLTKSGIANSFLTNNQMIKPPNLKRNIRSPPAASNGFVLLGLEGDEDDARSETQDTNFTDTTKSTTPPSNVNVDSPYLRDPSGNETIYLDFQGGSKRKRFPHIKSTTEAQPIGTFYNNIPLQAIPIPGANETSASQPQPHHLKSNLQNDTIIQWNMVKDPLTSEESSASNPVGYFQLTLDDDDENENNSINSNTSNIDPQIMQISGRLLAASPPPPPSQSQTPRPNELIRSGNRVLLNLPGDDYDDNLTSYTTTTVEPPLLSGNISSPASIPDPKPDDVVGSGNIVLINLVGDYDDDDNTTGNSSAPAGGPEIDNATVTGKVDNGLINIDNTTMNINASVPEPPVTNDTTTTVSPETTTEEILPIMTEDEDPRLVGDPEMRIMDDYEVYRRHGCTTFQC